MVESGQHQGGQRKSVRSDKGRSVMKNMVRCKACGYVMEERKLGDKCPACGAPKSSFSLYADPMSARRRRLLGFHLHPIAVHFPTALAVAVLVFAIAAPLFSGDPKSLLVSTVKVLVLFIPLVVIIAGLVGFVDGKVRFRKIKNSLILKRKIVYASVLLFVSLVMAITVWIGGFDNNLLAWLAVLLAAVAVVLCAALALLGMSITEAAFPGN
jgi:uncharacterized membrane protein